jgi:hypothetical protein
VAAILPGNGRVRSRQSADLHTVVHREFKDTVACSKLATLQRSADNLIGVPSETTNDNAALLRVPLAMGP